MTQAQAVRKAREVYVSVNGPDDSFFVTVTKRAALDLLRKADGQLGVCINRDGTLDIEAMGMFSDDSIRYA